MTLDEQAGDELRLLGRALDASTNGIVITDPNQPDNPIIYANSGFERITGYSAEEAIGENCRFLQGEDREQTARTKLRGAVESGSESRTVLRNYRKDGTLFYNEIRISPVRDGEGRLTHFIGVQDDVSERKRGEKQRAVQYGVSRFLTKTSDLTEVSQNILHIVGVGLDWDSAELWILDPGENALRRVDVWLRPSAWPAGFGKDGQPRLVQGEGLPGRVWAGAEPVWTPDAVPAGFSFPDGASDSGTGFGYPIRVGDKVVGVFGFYSRRLRKPDRDSVEVVRAVGNQIAQFMEHRRAEELMSEIREAERRHVALDLHDGVLQSVVGTLQGLQAIKIESATAGFSVEREIGELRQAMKGLREAIYDLRQEERQSLVHAVESLVELNRQHAPERSFDLVVQSNFPPKLHFEVETGLLRVLQEALANVRRHSGARRVAVGLRVEGDQVTLEVIDDGRGFDPWATAEGIGMPSMRERVAALSRKLRIQSAAGEGVSVTATVPNGAS